MSRSDIAPQYKSIFNFRKNEMKHKKLIKGISCACLSLFAVTALVGLYSQDTIAQYAKKHEVLNQQTSELEEQKAQIQEEKDQLEEERQQMLEEAEIIAKNNLYLAQENIKLQQSLKTAADVGIKPQNYGQAEEVTSPVDYSKLEYVGEFEGTAYTPSVEECSNNLGYTASGKPIIAGVSIAVDTKYWKLGTKFYVEGLGYVVAMDTGNAVKGKYRFDYAVFDKSYALKLGRQKWNVYLVKED
ncbi:MAG: hypothetical protein IJ217_01885 [Clostridia bacterium]|nr:hypothetical protein [Clostridia bacterium]